MATCAVYPIRAAMVPWLAFLLMPIEQTLILLNSSAISVALASSFCLLSVWQWYMVSLGFILLPQIAFPESNLPFPIFQSVLALHFIGSISSAWDNIFSAGNMRKKNTVNSKETLGKIMELKYFLTILFCLYLLFLFLFYFLFPFAWDLFEETPGGYSSAVLLCMLMEG